MKDATRWCTDAVKRIGYIVIVTRGHVKIRISVESTMSIIYLFIGSKYFHCYENLGPQKRVVFFRSYQFHTYVRT